MQKTNWPHFPLYFWADPFVNLKSKVATLFIMQSFFFWTFYRHAKIMGQRSETNNFFNNFQKWPEENEKISVRLIWPLWNMCWNPSYFQHYIKTSHQMPELCLLQSFDWLPSQRQLTVAILLEPAIIHFGLRWNNWDLHLCFPIFSVRARRFNR